MTPSDRPRLFAYKMLSGAPVRSHTATVELASQGPRTQLTSQVDSAPSIPVPDAVWSLVVKVVINQLLRGVVKRAERRTQAAAPLHRATAAGAES